MTEIQIEDLRPERLKEFWSVDAVAGLGDDARREQVWHSKRLLPFVNGRTCAGTEMKMLFVRVESLDEVGLQPLRSKIEQLT